METIIIDRADAAENSKMAQQLSQLLVNEPDLNGAIAGISIRSAASGQLIYDHHGDLRLRPASNLKIFTATAALSALGENHLFSTEILIDGKIKKSKLNGNLYIKGNGDPTLLKSDFFQLAKEIEKTGIKTICGNLIGDDSWYDDVRYSPDLPWSDETYYYGAQISALTASANHDFDTGSVIVEIIPAKKLGMKPVVKVKPKTNIIKIVNNAKTVAADKKRKINVTRIHAKNTIFVEGTIPIDAKKVRERTAVWEPTYYALDLFKQSIASQGILEGKIKRGKIPKTAQRLTTNKSMPLSKILIPFMKLSNNGIAETLVKEMGKVKNGEGSWQEGLSVLETETAKFGVNTKTLVIRDGSGVSHIDLIPANQITQLLYAVQNETWFPSFLQSLPVAGVKDKMIGGSLRNRLNQPPLLHKVQAKTGTLSTVSSLSGYVETISGQKLIFSILLNNLLDEDKGKKMEDKIVTVIANH